MSKFLRLIRNEWKKEFHKKTLWVMLIVLALFAALFAALASMEETSYDYYYSFEEMCEDEIAWNEEMLNDSGVSTEELDFYRINVECNRIMLEAEMDWNDWRYTLDLARLAVEAKYDGDTDTYEVLCRVIADNDVDGYYAWQMRTYESVYANDVARLRIYTDVVQYCIDNGLVPDPNTEPRYALILDMTENRETVLEQERLKENGGAWSASKLETAQNAVAIAAYQLENGVDVNPADSFDGDVLDGILYGEFTIKKTSSYWDAMAESVSMLSLVSVFVIVLAGSTVANEFSAGTIKFLLITPVRRWKILMSKYATMLLIGVMMCVVVWVMTMLSALMLGAGEAFLPAIFAENGEIRLTSPYLLLLGNYLLAMLEIVVMATLAFAISALVRKSSAAVGITVAADLMGSALSLVLMSLGFDWGRYLLFSNLDFVAIANGTSIYPHQSLVGAIVIVVLHMAVFLLTAYDAFVRREV
ncbi:MAG: ABC transporter permease [Clostridia bacterium]|nr:ABC transporter permease [Clostridia bacterium]